MKTAPMTKHQRIKDLSNKAEGIFHYIGPNDLLFRLISTGNQLASEVNHSVAFFTNFAQSGLMSGPASRSCIDQIYRLVGTLMCQIDVIHAAAGEFLNFNAREEPRDRKIVFHCTKSELDSIKRYADIIEVSYQEEDIHHA